MKDQLELWRRRWRDDVSFEQKAAIVVLFFGCVLVAGWLAADQLSTASAGVKSTSTESTRVETVDRVITVRERGKPVTTRIPVVKRVYVTRKVAVPAKTTSVVQTETVFGTRTVRVPTYVSHSVTAPGRTVTQTLTQTVSHTVTSVQWRVITVVEKSRPVTVTVTTSSP